MAKKTPAASGSLLTPGLVDAFVESVFTPPAKVEPAILALARTGLINTLSKYKADREAKRKAVDWESQFQQEKEEKAEATSALEVLSRILVGQPKYGFMVAACGVLPGVENKNRLIALLCAGAAEAMSDQEAVALFWENASRIGSRPLIMRAMTDLGLRVFSGKWAHSASQFGFLVRSDFATPSVNLLSAGRILTERDASGNSKLRYDGRTVDVWDVEVVKNLNRTRESYPDDFMQQLRELVGRVEGATGGLCPATRQIILPRDPLGEDYVAITPMHSATVHEAVGSANKKGACRVVTGVGGSKPRNVTIACQQGVGDAWLYEMVPVDLDQAYLMKLQKGGLVFSVAPRSRQWVVSGPRADIPKRLKVLGQQLAGQVAEAVEVVQLLTPEKSLCFAADVSAQPLGAVLALAARRRADPKVKDTLPKDEVEAMAQGVWEVLSAGEWDLSAYKNDLRRAFLAELDLVIPDLLGA